MNRWIGKVAVVTGASDGIGAAIACKLVENGLQVVGLARRKHLIDDMAKKLQGKSGKLHGISVDMTKEDEIIEAFKSIEKSYGCVHILINNAGVFHAGCNLRDGDTSKWRKMLELNVLGVCIASKEAIKLMKKCNVDGHIINMNSIAGHKIPSIFTDMGLYTASKHAVTAYTEQLRFELGNERSKIKITSISPGMVETEMVRTYSSNKKMEDTPITTVPPMLKPDDIACAVCCALSMPPEANITELTIQPVGEML